MLATEDAPASIVPRDVPCVLPLVLSLVACAVDAVEAVEDVSLCVELAPEEVEVLLHAPTAVVSTAQEPINLNVRMEHSLAREAVACTSA